MFRELEPMYDRRLSSDMFASPTVGEMKTSVEQFKKDVSGDQVLEFIHPPGFIDSPRSVPFVLSFSNLSYSVRTRRKMKLLSVFRRDGIHGNEFPATTTGGEANVDGVKVLRKTKVLLNGVSGEAQEGEIMAVLGASGSGKSTLIDALANRISKDSLKGSITLNGEPLSSQLMKVISAYVMQDDILYPMLTVEETLTFAADFRLPKTLSNSQKKSRVQTLIDQLGLRNAAKTIIGDEGHRGVSGGERRRVSIGTDIIHDPIILFLDEPTSGLDSTSAFMVVQVLQRIARSGSIVIMSIHQPSYRILGLLDRLIFLSHGDTVYSGPPEMLPRFFEDFGHPINLDVENRTEFALDFIRELEGSRGGTKSMVEFYKTWRIRKNDRAQSGTEPSPAKGLSLKEAISASISHGKLVSGASNDDSSTSTMVPKYANSILTEITVLSKRSFMNSRRQPGRFGTRLAFVIVTGFILATVFSQLDDSPKGIIERLGFFAFAMSTTFYSCADTLPVFLQEKYIFIRETAYNAYRRISYCVSHAIVSLPSLTFLAFAFSAITFWSVGLEGGFFGFCFFFAITLSSFWAGNSFVTFVSCIVPYVILGYVVVIAVLAYFLLFSGFFINLDRIPLYWIWFHYISLVKYPYEAVLQNEFDNRTKCFIRGTQIFDNSPLSMVSEEMKEKLLEKMSDTLGYVITKKTCLMNGVDILKLQGMNDLSKWNCLWITIAWGFLFRVLFYFCLVLGSKNKRR